MRLFLPKKYVAACHFRSNLCQNLVSTFSFTDFRVFFRIFFREFFREFFHELFRGLRFQIDNSFKGALHFIFHISLTLFLICWVGWHFLQFWTDFRLEILHFCIHIFCIIIQTLFWYFKNQKSIICLVIKQILCNIKNIYFWKFPR